MAIDPLSPSKENVTRAKRKFADLVFLINRHLQSSPYSVRVQRENSLSHIIARREVDLDVDLAFDCVEIVQRVRSALDKATVALVAQNGRGTSGIGFPFGSINNDTRKPYEFPSKRMKDALEKKLTPDQWKFICAKKPYPGGNDTLWAINEIANQDKHRADLVSVEPNLSHGFSIGSHPSGMTYIDALHYRPSQFQHLLADEGREEILISIGRSVSQLEIEHQFSVSVIFGNGFGVNRRDVLGTLNEQINQVDDIIKGLERFF